MISTTKSRQITVRIVNGFVKDGEGGNPAGVVLDADDLSADDMQQIARKVGMSETAFVSSSDQAGFRFDFFTPNRRIAHCGHATIAAFSYLAQIGRVGEGETSKMTVDGPRKIIIRGMESFMEQLAPKYAEPEGWAALGVTLADVLASVGLSEDDLIDSVAPKLVNTGNSFIVLPVRDADILARVAPDQEAIEAISEKLDLIGYYLFATGGEGTDATTRMFAPRYAIPEEAATGMAAGPLACFLHDAMGIRQSHFDIAQGDFMTPPSPSRISVDLERDADGAIRGLLAGGHGKSMRELTVTLG
ncbi:PhzF family phenazine biosynthesis protein [Aestuariicoccus sp. MJ-SS9]|uniref:PhzF family phenazine biosynthesis protein n=1 Tax=Aestuariicoccus sp. MJ-SS9 TaxID=3079855 RepID=UPI0029105F86|nr:PhzF family phenazine biosynthesis protein [Aestuariicoccus sp. MJ-SS9]MDU8913959.1 PhzF family phenazine biosynthesis protein [Aestuariicoccus sp. MJ-SS9]